MPDRKKLQPGQVYGFWTLVREFRRDGRYWWVVRCVCGKEREIRQALLTCVNGTRSCGCQHAESVRDRMTTHGGSDTPEFSSYTHAKYRCENPNNTSFKNYGGRGIKFLFDSFEQFLAEVGPKPSPRHSIDRIDVNGHYEPGNVQWATPLQQQANRRNSKRMEAVCQ